MIGSGKELLHFFNVTRSARSAAYVARLLARYGTDLARHGRAMRLTNGNALAGRLAKSAFDLGVPIWTRAPVTELIRDGARVVGAVVHRDGRPARVLAARGVVLAAGGFPQDIARRKALFPHAPSGVEHWSPAPPGNTGDGLRLGESVGGAPEDRYPNAAAWVPVSQVRHRDGTTGVFPHFIDRAKPGVIAVTPAGKRFVNEADSYHDFVQAMVAATQGGEHCAWLLADHPTLRRYGLGFAKPGPLPLLPYLRSGYLLRGATLAELAGKAGIDAAALERTVAEYNQHAARGEDPAFGRGRTAYNRYLGDPENKPNPCVAPLAKGPFYALKLLPGDLGTFAGLRGDRHARVLDGTGQPIPGLYAAGNDLASIMGGQLPGRRHHAGSRDDLRLHRGAPHGWPRGVMITLAGKLALVTGAGQGIGAALAEGLARAGASVIATDLDAAAATATAARIAGAGGQARGLGMDVTDPASCARAAEQAGPVGILVNNAGILWRGRLGDPGAREAWNPHHGRERDRHVQRDDGAAARATRESWRNRQPGQHPILRGPARLGRVFRVQGRGGAVHPRPGRGAGRGRDPGERHRPGHRGHRDQRPHPRRPRQAGPLPASRPPSPHRPPGGAGRPRGVPGIGRG